MAISTAEVELQVVRTVVPGSVGTAVQIARCPSQDLATTRTLSLKISFLSCQDALRAAPVTLPLNV